MLGGGLRYLVASIGTITRSSHRPAHHASYLSVSPRRSPVLRLRGLGS